MSSISLDTQNLSPFLSEAEIASWQDEVDRLHIAMEEGTGTGSDFLGWLHLPSAVSSELIQRIEQEAERIRKLADVFVCIGIGG